MAKLKKLKGGSKLIRKATNCNNIPKSYHSDFFEELVRQRGVDGARCFLQEGNGTLSEAISWNGSVKGREFWDTLEEKMLLKAGIITVKTKVSVPVEDEVVAEERKEASSEHHYERLLRTMLKELE